MLLIKILQQFLLPSTFIIVFIIIGFLMKKKKAGKIILIMGVCFYYLFSITPVSDYVLLPLEGNYSFLEEERIKEADKAVLLLGGRESNVLRGSEILRIYHLRDHDIKVIISGTDPLLPTSQEALAVKSFFVNRGMKEENIIIEGDSRNTWENIRNVKEVVGEKPFFLVTSAYHMERSMREFEKVGANPIPAPTDFKRKPVTYNVTDFIPNSQNLRKTDLAFHEYFGILYYRLVKL